MSTEQQYPEMAEEDELSHEPSSGSVSSISLSVTRRWKKPSAAPSPPRRHTVERTCEVTIHRPPASEDCSISSISLSVGQKSKARSVASSSYHGRRHTVESSEVATHRPRYRREFSREQVISTSKSNLFDDTFGDGSSRGVHFPVSKDDDLSFVTIKKWSGKVFATHLPWTDLHGKTGKYTGEVNDLMQPHGIGTLLYSDGSFQSSIWTNGMSNPRYDSKDKVKSDESIDETADESASTAKQPYVTDLADAKNKTRRLRGGTLFGNNPFLSDLNIDETEVDDVDTPHGMVISVKSNSNSEGEKSEIPPAASVEADDTCLKHLNLGDVGAPEDMVDHSIDGPHPESVALRRISCLKMHDFAFVRRSDQSWTYAILSDRTKEHMRFVTDGKGSTKTLAKRNWLGSIRLVNKNSVETAQITREVSPNCIVQKCEEDIGDTVRTIPHRLLARSVNISNLYIEDID